MPKQYRTLAPPDFIAIVDTHAHAVCAGDDACAESFVSARALDAHRAALARINSIRPLNSYDVIARARLGHHYIVKVRFRAAGGKELTLQNRWLNEASGEWRIVEVEDIGLRLPWVKPDKPPVNANA